MAATSEAPPTKPAALVVGETTQKDQGETSERTSWWSSILTSSERDLLFLSTAFKVLLWPCYHSTDFEVHRNWLAITRTLPIREWYFEATSQWTLDYPPFFAYFSWLLAQPATLVDPLIVSLHEGLEYADWPAKAYMRATVLTTELVLGAALVAHSRFGAQRRVKSGHTEEGQGGPETAEILAASLFMHPGLIIIDHIHFQYNGFLFGVLTWSLWAAREDRPLLCAFLFSSLLNLKHIYMYIAPSYFVFLLRSYVYPPGSTFSDLSRSFERLITLGAVTVTPFVLSLAPLLVDGLRHEAGPLGVLSQMTSRLFPFSRGLIHAYWAPNAWALWAFGDRFLVKALQRSPSLVDRLPSSFQAKFHESAATGFASASRGLVGHITFGVLPDIPPSTCFLLTLTCMLVYMLKLWQAPTYRSFLASISLCGFASFLFGWHVHEKAIMMVLIPYTLLAADDYAHFRTFVILSTAGIVSLFPLLYEVAEGPIKIAYTLAWSLLVFGALSKRVYRPVTSNVGILIHAGETLYLYGFIALQVYVSILHPMLFPMTPSPASSTTVVPTALNASSPALFVASIQPLATSEPMVSASESATACSSSLEIITSIEQVATQDLYPTETTSQILVPPNSQDAAMDAAMPTEAATVTVDTAAEVRSPTATSSSSSLLEMPTAPTPESPQAEAPSSMEFLPLMMVSVYCAIGVVWSWLRASSIYLVTQY